MRSRDEILFRLRQEAANVCMWVARPGTPPLTAAPLKGLPAPNDVASALRGTPYAEEVARLAAHIAAHRFPLLGTTVATGGTIEWRRDYSSGIVTPPRYFRLIPYLDPARAGDHKFIWELSRHQHWVLLAQAHLFTGRDEYVNEIRTSFDDWTHQNPFLAGINWTSALEVAFRALSWIWVYHLIGDRMDDAFRGRFLRGLYRHGRYLEPNLSVYFSPNTHLLGEAVALHALGALFPEFPEAQRWTETGGRIVREQMDAQVRDDGSHFEQSSYYHVYALDMFLFHAVLAEVPASYRERLARMAQYLSDLLGPARTLPFLGDDDGGRFFHPYGARDRFGRASLATAAVLLGENAWGASQEDAAEQAAWWIGPHMPPAAEPEFASRLHPSAGIAVMHSSSAHLLIDAGAFGPGSGGHSHSDTLSIVAHAHGEELLIDPGTYTYVGDPAWRDRFRGSAAHNTVRIDGRDQAEPVGPFRWASKPRVEIRSWTTGETCDHLEAAVFYAGHTHVRRVLFVKPALLFVLDDVDARAEQFWHTGVAVRALAPPAFALGTQATLVLVGGGDAEISEAGEYGWRSAALGVKVPAPLITVSRAEAGHFAAMLDLTGVHEANHLRMDEAEEGTIELHFEATQSGVVRFRPGAQPEFEAQ